MTEGIDPREAEFAAGSVLTLSKEVRADRDEVWRCLTEPDCFKAWWRNHVDFRPRAGSRFVEPWVDPSGRERRIAVEVTSLHPPTGFVMVWADEDWDFETVVSVTLSPLADKGGTLVTIEHQGWEKAPEADRVAHLLDHRAGWAGRLDTLARHAGGMGSAPPGGYLN